MRGLMAQQTQEGFEPEVDSTFLASWDGGGLAQKTKRPRLKESRDARPNSPPPSAARELAYVGTREMGMARMGYAHDLGLDRSNPNNQ